MFLTSSSDMFEEEGEMKTRGFSYTPIIPAGFMPIMSHDFLKCYEPFCDSIFLNKKKCTLQHLTLFFYSVSKT
jgi:hypothetical protein